MQVLYSQIRTNDYHDGLVISDLLTLIAPFAGYVIGTCWHCNKIQLSN